jgi:two-component system sensor histidine kinase MtrB
MRKHRLTLRTALVTITVSITVLVLLVASAVGLLTQYLKRTSSALADSVENVRAAEETQIALLMHASAPDQPTAAALEQEMSSNLETIRRDRTNRTALELTARADALVKEYLESVQSGRAPAAVASRHRAAYRVLDGISDLYVQQARDLRDTAAAWDRRLDIVGTVGVAGALGLAVWLLVWMQRQTFGPLFALAQAMERFGQGDYEARAEEQGPAELHEMAELFNQMATTLAVQREAQIAFLGGVAHDLRTPLSALRLSMDYLAPNQPLPPEPRLRRTIDIVQRQLKKLDRMVSDLIDMTKVNSGTLELCPGRHDLRTVVQDVVSLFEATGPEQQIHLRLPSDTVAVTCDSLRVEQIVSNLVSNAIKYSPKALKIEVALERTEQHAVISVRDYGIGISDEDQRYLFQPFHRATLAKETIPGAGLGLYVVRRLVEAHEGQIQVCSGPGQGACFTVRLPLGGPRAAARVEASREVAMDGKVA